MNNVTKRFTLGLLFAMVTLGVAAVAQADPPSRVARLGQISGQVSFAPAGEDEWVVALRNRPIVIGDRLWVAEGGHAELQMGAAVVRLDGGTSIAILNLDDRIAQLRVEQGALNVRVRRFASDDQFEIDTPNLAFAIRQQGAYRIDVDPTNNTTFVATRSGSAEVYGEGTAYSIANGQRYAFTGTRLEAARYSLPPSDAFDSWVQAQEQRYARSVSARYVSPDVVGYEDLDDQGSWRVVAEYGNVWIPRSVPANWAPYRYGHWAWIDPWGWTWVDDAPWGFAPFHYGRWARVGASWGWVPGPVAVRPVYAPALVAFVGDSGVNVSVTIGSAPQVAWFPLAPGEVYRPAYQVSRNYFTSINTSNTKINVTNATNIYNNRTTINEVKYVYREQPVAVTAVPTAVFARAEPVGRARLQVDRNALMRAKVVETAAVTPVAASVIGNAPKAAAKPRQDLQKRATIARAEPPAAPQPFSVRQAALAANPGGSPAQDSSRRAKADVAKPAPGVSDPKGSPPVRGSAPIVMVAPNTKAQPLPTAKEQMAEQPGGKEPKASAPAPREAPQAAEAPKGKEQKASAPPPRQAPQAAEAPKGKEQKASAPAPREAPQAAEAPKGKEQKASAPPPRQAPQAAEAPKGKEQKASAPPPRQAPQAAEAPKGKEQKASAPAPRDAPQAAEAPKGKERKASAPPPPREAPQAAEAPKGQERKASAPPPPREAPQAAEAPKGKERKASAPPPPPEAPQAEKSPKGKDQVARAPSRPGKDDDDKTKN